MSQRPSPWSDSDLFFIQHKAVSICNSQPQRSLFLERGQWVKHFSVPVRKLCISLLSICVHRCPSVLMFHASFTQRSREFGLSIDRDWGRRWTKWTEAQLRRSLKGARNSIQEVAQKKGAFIVDFTTGFRRSSNRRGSKSRVCSRSNSSGCG